MAVTSRRASVDLRPIEVIAGCPSAAAWLVERVALCIVHQGRLVHLSAAWERLLGVSPAAYEGSAFSRLFPHSESGKVAVNLARVAAGGEASFVSRHLTANGSERFLRWEMKLCDANLVCALASDVTQAQVAESERAELARVLEHSQRLASIGLLANKIVHDLNNLLMAIRSGAESVLAALSNDHESRSDMETIRGSLHYAAVLCRQLRAQASPAPLTLEPIELSSLVREMQPLLALAAGKDVQIEYELADELPTLIGQPVQIRQVLMNLVANACEALGERGGIIRVRTQAQHTTSALPGADANASPNRVTLSVSDDGCGMSPETKARLFEPFFSTKGSGRGVGLSATLGIVEAHRGNIVVESEPGQGATMSVEFRL
jgi:signal transduction histidine kinase